MSASCWETASGGFESAGEFPVEEAPTSVAVADFDQDGNQDIAVANSGSNNVSVLLGDGNGNFVSAGTFAVGVTPRAVAVGDFDGDGSIDIITADWSSNNISVLFNEP